MNKKMLTAAVVLLAGFGVLAGAPEAKEVNRTYHKHHKTYDQGKYYQISRDDMAYLIYFQWVKATQNKDGQVLIGLPEPSFWSGFNRRGMFNLQVNGISVYDLEPKEIKVFQEEKQAGIEVEYNFSGARMNLRFFMDDVSPVLHVEMIPSPKNKPGAVRTLKLAFGVDPSITGKPNGSYKRELLSPVKKYDKRGWTDLSPKDEYLVMYDTKYGFGKENPKSQSPVYLKLDFTGLEKGRIHYGPASSISFQLTYKPDCPKIALDILETRKQMTNQEFFDYLAEKKLIAKPEAAAPAEK